VLHPEEKVKEEVGQIVCLSVVGVAHGWIRDEGEMIALIAEHHGKG
jgi:hypothetical protein